MTTLVTRNFIFITLAGFFGSFGQQMMTATLPIYVLSLGGSQADVGLVSGIISLTAVLLRPLAGWATDAWRRRPMVLIGTASYGLASLVYLLASSVPTLLLGRIANGVGLCSFTTASSAYVADIAPPRRRAEAVGLYSVSSSLAMIGGPAIGFLIMSQLGFQRLFLLSSAFGFAALVAALWTREARPSHVGPRPTWSPRTGLVALEALPITWITFCTGIGFGTLLAFVSIFAQSRGIDNPGLYFTVFAISSLLAQALTGRLADRRGRALVIAPGLVLMASSLAVLTIARDLPAFLVSAAFFGLGFGAVQPATLALLVDLVRPDRRGLAMSTNFLGFDLGITLGSIGLGAISQAWGFDVVWLIAGAGTLLGLPGLLSARRSREGTQ